jgi:hypothetical protein
MYKFSCKYRTFTLYSVHCCSHQKVQQSLYRPIRGPVGFRRLRHPGLETFGTRRRYVCQPYTTVAFIPRKYSCYSFVLEAESIPGPLCVWKDYVKKNPNNTIGNRSRDLPACNAMPQPNVPPRTPTLIV